MTDIPEPSFEELRIQFTSLQLACTALLPQAQIEAQTHTITFKDSFGSALPYEVHAYDFVAPFLAGLLPAFLKSSVRLAYLCPAGQWLELPPVTPANHTMDIFADHPLWAKKQITTCVSVEIWCQDSGTKVKLHPMTTLEQVQQQLSAHLQQPVTLDCGNLVPQTLLAFGPDKPLKVTLQRPLPHARCAEKLASFHQHLCAHWRISIDQDQTYVVPADMLWGDFKKLTAQRRFSKNNTLFFGNEKHTLAQVGLVDGDHLQSSFGPFQQLQIVTLANHSLRSREIR